MYDSSPSIRRRTSTTAVAGPPARPPPTVPRGNAAARAAHPSSDRAPRRPRVRRCTPPAVAPRSAARPPEQPGPHRYRTEVPLPVNRMITLPDVDRIRTRDPNNHLHCRKTQLLAYAGSRSPWTDLLMYGALGSTSAIYRHCYLHGEDRWAFETPYVTDADLRLLGFEVQTAGRVDLARFEAELPEYLAAGQPVFFYAPRHHFPHWVEFMRRAGTLPEEYELLHSYLVCGVSDSGVLLVDNTTDDHEYVPLTVS